MMPVDTTTALALAAVLVLMLSFLAGRRRRETTHRTPSKEARSGGVSHTPLPARVLTVAERQAHTLLRQAMPGYLVLAQVPLSRFLSVRTDQSEWLQSISGLSADLLLCDSGSRVLAVVDIRTNKLSESSRRRHERMSALLRKAGIRVLTWQADELPDVALARQQLLPLLTGQNLDREVAQPVNSKPVPLIPVAEILAEGDQQHDEGGMEPVPSALFDDFELAPSHAQ